MKRIILLFCLFLTYTAFTQETEPDVHESNEYQTLFSGKDVKVRGFGGPMMEFTSIGNEFGHMMGGGGGIIINSFFFGGYGMGLTTEIPYSATESDLLLEYAHGGLWFGFIFKQKKAIHPSLHVRTGWGTISKYDPNDYGIDDYGDNPVFVVSPTAELEANISRFFKIGAGANYTFIYGNTPDEFPASKFENPSVFLSFKFGWFQ